MLLGYASILYNADFKRNCGSSSVVELHLAKVEVASSNLVSRSIGWRSQVVRPESAKLPFVGSIPTATSIFIYIYGRLAQVARAFA